MERYSVTELANGNRYERKGKLVPTVLHLIKRHAKSYQCSVDGHEIKRTSYKTWEGFLYEDAVIVYDTFAPFIVLAARSHVLIERKLIGSARLGEGIAWTDADEKALHRANVLAATKRKEIEKERRGRGQILTSFGRNEYA